MTNQLTKMMVALTIVTCFAFAGAAMAASFSGIPGLQIHLDADAVPGADSTSITSWSDSSGNNREATADLLLGGNVNGGLLRTNFVSGRSAMQLSNANDGFRYEDGGGTALSYTDMGIGSNGVTFAAVQLVDVFANDAGLYMPSSDFSVVFGHFLPSGGEAVGVQRAGGTARATGGNLPNDNQFYIVVGTMSSIAPNDSNTGNVYILDGDMSPTLAATNTWTNSAGGTGDRAGFFTNPGTTAFLSELAIWDRELTANEIQGVFSRLNDEYGFIDAFPDPTIPEPATIAMLGMGALPVLRRRRR